MYDSKGCIVGLKKKPEGKIFECFKWNLSAVKKNMRVYILNGLIS